jgi:hypothetical protein
MSVASALANEVEGEIVPERHGDSDVISNLLIKT